MKKRIKVLTDLTKSFVQRRDYSVLTKVGVLTAAIILI